MYGHLVRLALWLLVVETKSCINTTSHTVHSSFNYFILFSSFNLLLSGGRDRRCGECFAFPHQLTPPLLAARLSWQLHCCRMMSPEITRNVFSLSSTKSVLPLLYFLYFLNLYLCNLLMKFSILRIYQTWKFLILIKFI